MENDMEKKVANVKREGDTAGGVSIQDLSMIRISFLQIIYTVSLPNYPILTIIESTNKENVNLDLYC